MAKRRAKRKPVAALEPIVCPTPEQAERWPMRREAMSYRRVPVIDTMRDAGHLSRDQYDALAYYRSQATQAEDDCAVGGQLDPAKAMGGRSEHVGSYIPAQLFASPAMIETARIERDLGPMTALTRAVAVNDVSLTQWCVDQFGGRERYNRQGRFVEMVPLREKDRIKDARIQLRYAAGMIVR